MSGEERRRSIRVSVGVETRRHGTKALLHSKHGGLERCTGVIPIFTNQSRSRMFNPQPL
jgi:hypothetical protein